MINLLNKIEPFQAAYAAVNEILSVMLPKKRF